MIRIIITALILSIAQAQAASYRSPQHDRVVQHFKQNEESVFEAVWFNPNYLKVTRYDTGSSQNGFAQYICQVLVDTGYKGRPVDVEIIDVIKLTQRKEWRVIGEANCSYHLRR